MLDARCVYYLGIHFVKCNPDNGKMRCEKNAFPFHKIDVNMVHFAKLT